MQYFYNSGEGIGQSVIIPPGWTYVRDGLERNLKVVKEYYYNRPHAVKNTNILVKLLTNLGVPYDLHLERFYDIVDARALQYSMSFKMTSSLYRGAFFKNAFYGGNTMEVLVANNDSIDPYYVYNNWREVQSVKVVDHPKSDLDLLLPNGRMASSGDGVAVIEINIPTLAIQFRAFMDEQMKRSAGGMLSPQSTAQFIHMHVLPNMLDTHLNIALFNRAYNLTVGAPMGITERKHPFYLTSFNDQVDKVYKIQIDHLKNTERDFKSILKTFQCLNGTFADALRLPGTASTRQIVWVEFIARLRAMDFMTDLSVSRGRAKNTNDINQFMRSLKMFESDKLLVTALPAEVHDDVQNMIYSIKSKVRF